MFLHFACWVYQRMNILRKIGRKDTANVIKMWTEGIRSSTEYWIQYRFTFSDIVYKINAEISYSEWNKLKMQSHIQIIFDPENPQSNNIPFSKLRSECCDVIMLIIFSNAYILGFGLGFGIGVFQLKWYHIIVATLLIPGGAFIICGP